MRSLPALVFTSPTAVGIRFEFRWTNLDLFVCVGKLNQLRLTMKFSYSLEIHLFLLIFQVAKKSTGMSGVPTGKVKDIVGQVVIILISWANIAKKAASVLLPVRKLSWKKCLWSVVERCIEEMIKFFRCIYEAIAEIVQQVQGSFLQFKKPFLHHSSD